MEAELRGLKLGALSKRARAAGATHDELDEAQDADDPKAAVITLILQHADPDRQLREELRGLKLGALSKRARAAGATHDELDEAQDADNPKAAVIELIIRAESIAEAVPERRDSATGLEEPPQQEPGPEP